MSNFVQFHVNISWIKIESLLALTLKQYNISILHTLLKLEVQISRSKSDFISGTYRTFLLSTYAWTSTFLTFHFHFLHLTFYIDLTNHLTWSWTNWTRMFNSCLLTCSFAMLTYLPSPKTVNHISSCIEFIKRNPHFCTKISSFSEWIFFQLFKTCLSMKIIGNTLGNVNQDLICVFYFNIF